MAGVGSVGVFLVKFSNKTSVLLAFSIVSLAAAHGTNVREPTSSRLVPDTEGVDAVGGGGVKPRLFEECTSVEGWKGGWTGEAIVSDGVGVEGP